MIKVVSGDRKKDRQFESALSSITSKHRIIFNMGGRVPRGDIYINNMAVQLYMNDRRVRNSIIGKFSPLLEVMARDANYPLIVKKRKKRDKLNCHEDSSIIESLKEFKVFNGIFGGESYCETIFKPTSEYLIFTSRDEVFFAVKAIRKPQFKDTVIVPDTAYNFVTEFVKPKLWKSIQDSCISITANIGADICVSKVAYNSTFDNHKYVIHNVTVNLPFIEELINPLGKLVEKLIIEKVPLIEKMRRMPTEECTWDIFDALEANDNGDSPIMDEDDDDDEEWSDDHDDDEE